MLIDKKLMELNDDYKVERSSALKDVKLKVIPTATFYGWMELQGKIGSQHKFPRVLKKEKSSHWKKFLTEQNLVIS